MNKIVYILLVLVLTHLSCQKSDFSVTNLNDDIVGVIGHGGMGIAHLYPMNSYQSINRAAGLGADGVEIDVQMTNDGVFVAYHDYELSERSSAYGQIYNQSWAEISNTTYNNPFFPSYQVIRVDSLISGITNRDELLFVFDIKSFNPDTTSYFKEKLTGSLISLLDEYKLGNNVFIELKRPDLVRALKKKRKGLLIFYYNEDFYKAIESAINLKLQGVTVPIQGLSPEKVKYAHEKGVMVSVFNTNSRSRNRRAIEMNVDFIQTDNLKYLTKLLKNSPHSNL